MIKRLMAILTASALTFSLAACGGENTGGKDSSTADSGQSSAASPSFKIDGEKVDTDGLVFLDIEGNEIGFDELRYGYYEFLNTYGSIYGFSDEEFKEEAQNGKSDLFDDFKSKLKVYIKSNYVYEVYADRNNIALEEEDKEQVSANLEKIKSEQGDDYENYLKEKYVTEELLIEILNRNYTALKVEESMSVSDKEFLKIAEKDLYQIKEIFIPFGSESEIADDIKSSAQEEGVDDIDKLSNTEKLTYILANYDNMDSDEQKAAQKETKKTAEEVLKKLESGLSFDKMVEKYNYSSDMEDYPKGLLIGENYAYSDEFIDAAMSLDENQISELVETDSGYYILYRVPTNVSYVKKQAADFAKTYNTGLITSTLDEVYDSVKVKETDIYKNFKYGDLT